MKLYGKNSNLSACSKLEPAILIFYWYALSTPDAPANSKQRNHQSRSLMHTLWVQMEQQAIIKADSSCSPNGRQSIGGNTCIRPNKLHFRLNNPISVVQRLSSHTPKDRFSTSICSYSSRSEHANRPNPDLYNSDRVCPPHTHTSLPSRSTYLPNTLTLQSGKPAVHVNRCSCKPYEQSRCVRCPAIPCSSRPLFVCGQTGI